VVSEKWSRSQSSREAFQLWFRRLNGRGESFYLAFLTCTLVDVFSLAELVCCRLEIWIFVEACVLLVRGTC
jgi:hypothetical protein